MRIHHWHPNLRVSPLLRPCNNTGFTDPETTKSWSIIDFDWSNAKELWVKNHPMNDEELLQEQVVMTTSQSQIGQSVWVYRGSMWGKFYVSITPAVGDFFF